MFTNKDAEWLAWFVRQIEDGNGALDVDERTVLRLQAIAQNLQSLDDKSFDAFQRGFRAGEAAVYGRSNIVPKGEALSAERAEAIAQAIAQAPVRKVSVGVTAKQAIERGNERKRRDAKARTAPLKLSIDLSKLGL
jgi:hypothetical protein